MTHTSTRRIAPFSGVVALILFAAASTAGAAERAAVGAVEQLKASAKAVYEEQARSLQIESAVRFEDRLETGPEARLRARLLDGSEVTLGAHAAVVVDRFVYDPAGSSPGALSLRVVEGAFLFVSGQIKRFDGSRMEIVTPVATLGIRGTQVWGGSIDGGYGIFAQEGTVVVEAPGGTVTLTDGQGTMIFDVAAAPGAPTQWATEKVERALRTVAFAP